MVDNCLKIRQSVRVLFRINILGFSYTKYMIFCFTMARYRIENEGRSISSLYTKELKSILLHRGR